MILFKKAADLRKWLDAQQKDKFMIGFIPTMGALHEGHLSLIELSKRDNPVTLCSIFVNPTQFNDPKDFEKYPVTIEKDIAMLEATGCDVLFLPSVKEMYPEGVKSKMQYELGYLETVLEGKFRPGHFQGVCMVVQRLLEIVKPDNLYLGQKDYQQCMVITKLVGLINQGKKIRVNICPTLRETDGLAMSSRNMRLDLSARNASIAIYQSLVMVKENIQIEPISDLKQKAQSLLEKAGFKVEYFEISDASDLSPVNKYDIEEKIVALVAAYIHEVRLIDNMLLN